VVLRCQVAALAEKRNRIMDVNPVRWIGDDDSVRIVSDLEDIEA
jgi:hypothetical protein